MKDYLAFSAEDFALDEDFMRWVKYPEADAALDSFWGHWLRENAHKREVVEEARQMILAVAREEQHVPGRLRREEVWSRIENSIQADRRNRPLRIAWSRWYSMAAMIVAALAVGWLALQPRKADPLAVAAKDVGVSHYIKEINNSDAPKTIILSDGTAIVLRAHTSLEYPSTFSSDSREVFLRGEAFFEVAHDATRPFLVHADKIVTRVLGTSFSVRNYPEETDVVVQVKTGKVSVFAETERTEPRSRDDRKVEGVVLMPNQQVMYERAGKRMVKSLVENPSVLASGASEEFQFKDTPAKDVFAAIEKAYGVDILFDEEGLSDCYLNASLSEVPLYEKLNLICKGINATYEIIDSHIIVYGKGCK